MTAFQKRDQFGGATYNPWERPSMPLSALALDGIIGSGGSNESGEHVDEDKALAIPTAYRCVRIIATVIGSLILEELQRDGLAERWEPMYDLVSHTGYEILSIIAARMAGWGEFFGKETISNRKLVDLTPYPAGDVTVIKKRGVKTYRIKRRDGDGNLIMASSTSDQPLFDDITDGPDCPVLHIFPFSADGLRGINPVIAAAQMYGTTLAANRLAAKFYSRGQMLGGIVKVKVPLANQSQADAIKYAWRGAHQGIQTAGDVAVLDSESDFQSITIAPDALQFLESRGFQATEVARMYGVPGHLVELGTQSSWGSGIEQLNTGFVTYTIAGYTNPIEQRLDRKYGTRGKPLEFDLDRLLRGSMLERYQAYGQGIGWGFLTPNEVRKEERRPPKTGADDLLTPQAQNGALSDAPMAEGGAAKGAGVQNSKKLDDAAPAGPGQKDGK